MTLKLESTKTELRKGWNVAWYHNLTHITRVKSWEDYGKNWMNFVYKLDHQFQSKKVSEENTSVSKAFHFSQLISTQDFFSSNIQHSKPHTEISTLSDFIFDIFHAFNDLFWAKWPWNWKAVQMNSEKVETWHGIIIWPT